MIQVILMIKIFKVCLKLCKRLKSFSKKKKKKKEDFLAMP